MARNHVFIIDDEPDLAQFISRVAAGCGFDATVVGDARQLRRDLADSRASHIILDLKMPGIDGIEVLRHLAGTRSRAKVIILSGAEQKVLEAARRFGVESGLDMVGTLQKPIRAADLREVLTKLRDDDRWPSDDELAAAIDGGQLFVEYQPRVSLPSQALAGVEALVRWKHPTRGIVPPSVFLGAPSDGVLGRVTSFVAATALAQIAGWREQGLDLSLSINLSGRSLSTPQFADTMEAECQRFGIAADRVTLELTDLAPVAGDMQDDVLTRLRLKDFRLSIDDFGTGPATLVQLYRLPFCEVKIDGTLVRDAQHSLPAQLIVRTMIGLAHDLGLETCAEGVESAGVLQLLKDFGCDRAQGHAIARPMSAPFLPAWARSQQRHEIEGAAAQARSVG